ncbi:hypothetical protein NMS01_003491 [Vibrio cholerae]|nr:hypothetical protein [Vibrio cholerae]
MSLSSITASKVRDTGFASGEHKGFTVHVTPTRHGFKFSIMLMLEDNSDAAHVIASAKPSLGIVELKEQVKEIVSNYPYTAKQLHAMHKDSDLNNLSSNVIFTTNNGAIVQGLL